LWWYATGQLSELLEGQPTIGSAEQNENPIHSVESLKLPCPFFHWKIGLEAPVADLISYGFWVFCTEILANSRLTSNRLIHLKLALF
jgi:hypothetical protein